MTQVFLVVLVCLHSPQILVINYIAAEPDFHSAWTVLLATNQQVPPIFPSSPPSFLTHFFPLLPPPCGCGTTRDLIIKMTNYFITRECGVRWYPPN